MDVCPSSIFSALTIIVDIRHCKRSRCFALDTCFNYSTVPCRYPSVRISGSAASFDQHTEHLAGASPGRKQWGGQKARVGLMASAEREPITGFTRQSPLKLKAFCRWTTQTRGKICHFSLVFLKPPSKPKIVLGMDRTCELLALESFSDYCK